MKALVVLLFLSCACLGQLGDPAFISSLTQPSSDTGFDPASVAGILAWYKADSLSLTDNDPISSWSDSSGNGNTIVQGTGSAQPTYKSNIQNGLPVARFDGGDSLSVATASTYSQPNTIFAVVLSDEIPSADRCYFDSTNNSSRCSAHIRSYFGLYCGSLLTKGTVSASTWWLITSVANGASSMIFTNTVQAGTTGDSGSSAIDGIYIGTTPGGKFWLGDIGEVIVYNAEITGTDKSNIENYLKTKWATP